MSSPRSLGAHFAPAPIPILQRASRYPGYPEFRNRASLPTEHRQHQRPPSPSAIRRESKEPRRRTRKQARAEMSN
jgi:hypothetical protein